MQQTALVGGSASRAAAGGGNRLPRPDGCPDEAKARSDLGAQYHQASRYAEAEAQLRRSLELDPTSSVALNNLAVTLAVAPPPP